MLPQQRARSLNTNLSILRVH